MRRCELPAVAIFTILWTCGGWALAQALAAEELRFGDALREEQFGIGVELPSLTVQSGEYDVNLETAKANLLAQHLVVSGALRLKGGTFRMGKKPVLVFGDLYFGSGATFIPGTAPLILDGDPTILSVEKKAKTIIIPARYGPVYGLTGAVLVETGVLLTETGSRTEWYTPTLGDVHIGASPGTTFLSSDTTFSFLQVGTGDTLVSSGYALTVNGSSTGGTLIYGELRLNGRVGATTQTLFTQRHNYFRTSGNGKVTTVSGTGTVLLIGSGADAGAPFSLTISGSLQNLILDSGLVGYWKLDDGVGVTARDSSGDGNHGTFNGNPQWDGDAADRPVLQYFNPFSVQLDGSTDEIDTGTAILSTSDGSQPYTFSAWIKTTNTNAFRTILSQYTAGASDRFGLFVSGGKLLWWKGSDKAKSTANVNNGTWQHVAGVRASNGAVTLYINGNVDGTGTDTDDFSDNSFVIGDLAGAAFEFTGHIDDVRIYDRVLSHSEIQALANGNKSTGSGVYTLGSALDVNGNLNIYAGTLDPTADNYNITVGGNAQIHGEITKRSNTFTMDGTSQTLSGSTVFHNFTKTMTAADTLYLDHSARQNFSGALTVRGAAGNLLSLRSTRVGSGTNFLLDADTGTQTIDYLDVQDNDASGGAELVCTGCTDSGRNTNWSFVAAAEAVKKMKHWFFFLE